MKRSFTGISLAILILLSVQCSSPPTHSSSAEGVKFENSSNPTLSVEGTKPTVAPELLLKSRILALLKKGKYQELDSLLESYQREFEQDFHKEEKLAEAFDSFSADDPMLEGQLNDWIKDYPKSYSALLARAHYFNSRGWIRRGFRGAGEISHTQFALMEANFQKAAQDVAEALKLKSNLIAGFCLLLNMEKTAPEFDRDARLLERALALCPASFLIRKIHIEKLEPRWGGSYQEMRQFAEAAQEYAPLNPKLKVLKGFVDWDKGRTLEESDERKGEAIEAYTRALFYGDYWLFYHERSRTFYHMGRYTEALEDGNRAVALRPQEEECYILRSRIFFFMEKPGHALRDLQVAGQIWPYDTDNAKWGRSVAKRLVYSAYQLYQQSQFAGAIEKYDLAAEFDPDNVETYYWRGTAYMKQGMLAEAERDLEKSVQQNPRHFESYRWLDWVLARQGKWDTILEYWNRFLDLEPNHARAYLERGDTFYHKGDLKSALRDAEKACELGEAEACALGQSLKQKV